MPGIVQGSQKREFKEEHSMRRMKRVLIVSVDHECPVENMVGFRRTLLDHINEGVVVLPPWCTGTVTDLDICGGEKDEAN